MIWEAFKFLDLVQLTLEILQYHVNIDHSSQILSVHME